MHDYIETRSTISASEKQAIEKMLSEKHKILKPSSMLGVCSATDDWRERNNAKQKVVFKISERNSPMVGVK